MGWMGDVRVALRTLRRSPGFTTVCVGTLAVGIGANAAMFSLVDGVLLEPPPYERPDELVLVWNTLAGSDERWPVAAPDAAALSERSRLLAEVAFTIRGVDGAVEADDGSAARHVRLAEVTDNFFKVLGAEAALGRVFAESDVTLGSAGPQNGITVVLADRLWRGAFNADPDIVGREIRMNGWPVTVVGVMPPGFTLALPPDAGVVTDVDVWLPIWVPLTEFHPRSEGQLRDRDTDNTGVVVARLAPGATPAQARAEVDRIAADLRDEIPAYAAAGLGLDVRPLQRDATSHARPVLVALLAGVAVLLLVACLNLATLVMARGMGRAQEFAVRAALGGGRGRLARQLVVENGVLVVLGLVAALALAQALLPVLAARVPATLWPAGGVSLDLRTVAFAGALAGGAALLFGLLPAVRAASQDGRGVLGSGMARGRAGRTQGRSRLVAAQVSLSVVLALGAGLLLRTVSALEDVRPGFDTASALTFRISLRVPDRYRSPALRADLMKEIEASVSELPGVRTVGLVGVLPLGGGRWSQPYGLPGQPETEWEENRADFQMITSGYFEAMRARLIEGRSFTAQEDLVEEERVVVVDEKLAARIAPGGSALDAVIGMPLDGSAVEARVVGVVEHIRHDRLDLDGREAIYVPYRQEASRDVAFVVRASADPAALAPAIRRAVEELDPQIPVYDVRTLEDYVDLAVAPRRFAFSLLLSFAGLALVCAALGLYGVVAFDVSRRTRDIGIRMAVGASRADVMRPVLARGFRLGAAGLAGGVILGAVAARAMAGLVFGVGLGDPLTWTAVVVLVTAVTVAASWIPARRASRLSPTLALRME